MKAQKLQVKVFNSFLILWCQYILYVPSYDIYVKHLETLYWHSEILGNSCFKRWDIESDITFYTTSIKNPWIARYF